MCKRLISLAFVLFSVITLFAQEKINIQFVNQYEEALKEVIIVNDGKSTEYTTDEQGFADIEVSAADSVTISLEGYETKVTSVSALKEKNKVELKKNFTWKDLLNPMFYIINGGLWLILFIVFAETGLFAGFFLPGDSLLFVAGIYSSDLMREFYKTFNVETLQNEWIDLFLLVGLITVMGIIGNMVGYWFGRKIGPAMFNWKDRFLFKKKYLHDAHEFFEKHGGSAIVFARFLPIVRTFAPIVAGIVTMDRKKFMFYNIVGCFAWVFSMIFAGHFLQIWVRKQFGFELREHLEAIVIVIVLVTTLPVFWKLFFGKSKAPKIKDHNDPQQ
ncbi:MAG: VTT domain-containing protein [Chitinophagaceae bacterium]|nr:VTT domain-containing protein [Chitinophagaceae bacterium]MCW5928146.1 VTT domain-containing protein [Chitinophagaceae bacterium]